jgi:two-component system alkaline phosphatase synthesis response regulator PhoP
MYDTKILIVDDERENVRYLQTVLEENGFKNIVAAHDGEEGFLKVKEERPGLILLDLRMPKKSGIWLFNELKKSDEFRDIPVVILTGEGGFLRHLAELREFHEGREGLGDLKTEEVLNRFIYSRPDGFLEKPIEPAQLLQVVRKILITLDEVKRELVERVRAVRQRMMARDLEYKGLRLTLGNGLVGLLSLNLALLSMGIEPPQEAYIPLKDGKVLAVNRDELVDLARKIRDYLVEMERVAMAHEKAIFELTEMEKAQSYDVQRGWPSNLLGGLT